MRRFDYSLEGFEITKWGGGLAYTVRKDGQSFYVQGDDASQFEEDLDAAIESTGPYGAKEFLADGMGALGQSDE